jgi:hypothetical protein
VAVGGKKGMDERSVAGDRQVFHTARLMQEPTQEPVRERGEQLKDNSLFWQPATSGIFILKGWWREILGHRIISTCVPDSP